MLTGNGLFLVETFNIKKTKNKPVTTLQVYAGDLTINSFSRTVYCHIRRTGTTASDWYCNYRDFNSLCVLNMLQILQ